MEMHRVSSTLHGCAMLPDPPPPRRAPPAPRRAPVRRSSSSRRISAAVLLARSEVALRSAWAGTNRCAARPHRGHAVSVWISRPSSHCGSSQNAEPSRCPAISRGGQRRRRPRPSPGGCGPSARSTGAPPGPGAGQGCAGRAPGGSSRRARPDSSRRTPHQRLRKHVQEVADRVRTRTLPLPALAVPVRGQRGAAAGAQAPAVAAQSVVEPVQMPGGCPAALPAAGGAQSAEPFEADDRRPGPLLATAATAAAAVLVVHGARFASQWGQ